MSFWNGFEKQAMLTHQKAVALGALGLGTVGGIAGYHSDDTGGGVAGAVRGGAIGAAGGAAAAHYGWKAGGGLSNWMHRAEDAGQKVQRSAVKGRQSPLEELRSRFSGVGEGSPAKRSVEHRHVNEKVKKNLKVISGGKSEMPSGLREAKDRAINRGHLHIVK